MCDPFQRTPLAGHRAGTPPPAPTQVAFAGAEDGADVHRGGRGPGRLGRRGPCRASARNPGSAACGGSKEFSDRLGQLAGSRVAFLGSLGHELPHHGRDARRRLGPQLSQRHRLHQPMVIQLLGNRLGLGEGNAAGEKEIERAAEAVEVGTRPPCAGPGLFRSDVIGGAEEGAFRGQCADGCAAARR
jgi:hypothetical protein